jgi:hypothetical protein
LRKDKFHNELDTLIIEMKDYKNEYGQLKRNEFHYVYLMGEILRKYFGPEIYMQNHYIHNRTPYLDMNFIKELFNSFYCGVYSDYFTHNPIKRYKGQLVYPYIIKKTFPELLDLKTGKGYKPNTLLSQKGKIELVLNLLRKKIVRSKLQSSDPFAVVKAFQYNRDKWLNVDIRDDLYNKDVILSDIVHGDHEVDVLTNILSANYYISDNHTA